MITLHLTADVQADRRVVLTLPPEVPTGQTELVVTVASPSPNRPLPKGMGKYHSGNGNVSENARDLLRQAVKDGLWP